MGTNTTLDDVLNNIVNQYENQIAHAPGIEEKRKLERFRNREIVKCLSTVLASKVFTDPITQRIADGLSAKIEAERQGGA